MKEHIPVPWILRDIMNTTILKVLIEERNLHSSKPFFNLATLGWFMNLLYTAPLKTDVLHPGS